MASGRNGTLLGERQWAKLCNNILKADRVVSGSEKDGQKMVKSPRIFIWTPLSLYGLSCWNKWCRRSESNRHGLAARGILSPVRLPVSPLRHRHQYKKNHFGCQFPKKIPLHPHLNPLPFRERENSLNTLIEIWQLFFLYVNLFFKSGGAVAQLGERLNGIQEADGSIPFSSTN